MPRRRRLVVAPASAFALLAVATATPARAHDEWNLLHITNASRTEFVYPFDGRTPKVGASLLNHHAVTAPEVVAALVVDGQRQAAASPFRTFPDGGSIVVGSDSFGFAHALTGAIYEGRAGPPPAVGQVREVAFAFVFQLAPGAVAPPGQVPVPGPTYTQDTRVRFTNLGDNPTLGGPLPLSGAVRAAAASAASSVRVEVSTPYSNWFLVPSTIGENARLFAQSLPSRADWHVRLSADGHASRVIPLGHPNNPRPQIDVTLPATEPVVLDYQRIAAIATSTGFWRGAVSETEGTFVAFPGQETWRTAATDAEARTLRHAGRIAKYRFDGTRLWEHAPGWETWAGDMSADGRFVAYALHPATHSFYTPIEHKLVLLDGATGNVLWSKSAPPSDPAIGRRIDALELAFSPDARWLAVGSAGAGTVTLVDRATGNFAWTVPGAGTPGFGQIRKLRFSPDGRFLYCGSGDSHIRQLRVSDGAILWKVHAGGWPYVNGLDLTPAGSWLAAGTRSLDATMIRTRDGLVQWQRETQHADAVFAPDGRHVVTAGGQVYRTLDGELVGMTKLAASARFTPDSAHFLQLGADLRLYDLSGKLVRTFESSGLTAPPAELPFWTHLSADGRYAILLARDMPAPPQTGIVIYERRTAPVSESPRVVSQPLSQTIAVGATATLFAGGTGAPPLAYRWFKDGTPLRGAHSSVLTIPDFAAEHAGSYHCIIANAVTNTATTPAALQLGEAASANPPRLGNLAVRTQLGSTPFIVGFALGGRGTSGTKPLLLRAVGPSLATVGVTGPLADPRLELFSGSTRVLNNDNWSDNAAITAVGAQVGAFPLVPESSDAALVATAVSGSYTAQIVREPVASAPAEGSVLAEIYDASDRFTATTPRLTNVSARAGVTPANVLIAGFVVTGSAARPVLIRGIGPGLATFGVPTPLANPQLSLFRSANNVAANNDWHDAPNAVAIAEAATLVGAFPLAPGSTDAALLLSLPPGNYTAQLSGGTGNALIEVYEVP